jgi:hypothetical protein
MSGRIVLAHRRRSCFYFVRSRVIQAAINKTYFKIKLKPINIRTVKASDSFSVQKQYRGKIEIKGQ